MVTTPERGSEIHRHTFVQMPTVVIGFHKACWITRIDMKGVEVCADALDGGEVLQKGTESAPGGRGGRLLVTGIPALQMHLREGLCWLSIGLHRLCCWTRD
jgi:hypothetical protein